MSISFSLSTLLVLSALLSKKGERRASFKKEMEEEETEDLCESLAQGFQNLRVLVGRSRAPKLRSDATVLTTGRQCQRDDGDAVVAARLRGDNGGGAAALHAIQ